MEIDPREKPSVFCRCTPTEIMAIEQFLLQLVHKNRMKIDEKTRELFRNQTSRTDLIYLMQKEINKHDPILYKENKLPESIIKSLNKFNQVNNWDFRD
jgi:hypothetical protein